MFKDLGKINYLLKKSHTKFDLEQIRDGENYFDEFIIYKDKKKIKVYDRVCNHAGGKIITKRGENICPIHNWKFNPKTGLYLNGVKKREHDFSISKNFLKLERIKLTPSIKKLYTQKSKLSIRFFNHAFLSVLGEGYSFATDPWAIGPAFNTGWWLKYKTKQDWIENLKKCSFIYISHNHPDHLHPLTLSKIEKNKPIIVPSFITDSTGNFMESLGFTNVIRLKFDQQYNLEGTSLVLAILKSGDFREDSGIYFSDSNFSCLFDVDSNMINFERFPQVDLYASSFAGGASGYPLMFENYNQNDQINISKKDKNFLKTKKIEYLKKIKPKFFLPYAGFFEEKLKRDTRIKKFNQKNSINDYKEFCKENNINLLNVEKNDYFLFHNGKLKNSENINQKNYIDLKQDEYLNFYKKEYDKIDDKYIENYFKNSLFKDNLILYIVLTNDDFLPINKCYLVNFSKKPINFKKLSNFDPLKVLNKSKNKVLILKIRKESFLNTIYNKLPWEDLSIGFQCKILRHPNEYNAKYWYHFTNIYITDKHVRVSSKCNSCIKLSEFFDQKTYQSIGKV
jgi:CMP-N-acetylneuraminate monooxygenase